MFVVKVGVCVAVGAHSHVLCPQRVQTCNRISGLIPIHLERIQLVLTRILGMWECEDLSL